MAEKLVYLKCCWCECEWHEGDPEGDWFSFTPEFGEQEELQFCSVPCMFSYL